jgi:succinate dehydrogenase hydrophobic anchor subunit
MTQEKLDALQAINDKWNHILSHMFGVAILIIVTIIILIGIADILDDYFDSDSACKCALFLGGMIAVGVWLL